ncbi:hypothetical protein H0G72_05790 [Liberibacter sp. Z1]|nr:hypothetical protein [Candidatus Liberibacter sp.]
MVFKNAKGDTAYCGLNASGYAMSGAFDPRSGKLTSGFSSGKDGDIYIITSEGKAILLVNSNSTNPLEDIRKNIKAVSQDELDTQIKALESKPSGGGSGAGGITAQEALSLLQGRTVLMPMVGSFEVDKTYKFTTANNWRFPSEASNGYMHAGSFITIPLTEEEASKTWRCVACYLFASYAGRTSWFQEVVDKEATVLRAVSSSTLQDNLVDLKAMSQKITMLENELQKLKRS